MIETVSLKPCPECEGQYIQRHKSPKGYLHRCDDCGYQQGAIVRTADQAITAWNTRASEAHTLRVAEAVREACAGVADELGGVRERNLENEQFRAQHVRAKTIATAIRALDVGLIVEGVEK